MRRLFRSTSPTCFPVRHASVAGVTDVTAFEARLAEVAGEMERVLARLDENADWNEALYTPLNVDVEVLETGKVARRTELDFAAACRTYLPTQGLLLLGDPGGGKSTSLRHLARQGLHEVGISGVLPVHANLRQWAGAGRPADEGGVSLLDFVRAALRKSLPGAHADFLDAHLDGLLAAGRVAFLLDSFDEIPVLLDRDDASDALAALSAELEAVASLAGSPMLLVASRYFRRPRLKAREFLIVELKPFPDTRLHAVAAARGNLPQAHLDAFLGRGGPWLKHARNPFMAMLLFDHLARHKGEEPHDLAALYEGFVQARLATTIGKDAAARVVRSAQLIAEAMLIGSDGGLEGSIRGVTERLAGTPDLDVPATVDALVGVRIVRRGMEDADNFTFVHRRFNEYFLALRWQANGTVPDLSAIVGDRKERDALVIHAEVASEGERRRILAWCLGFVADALNRGHWERVARGEAGRTVGVVAKEPHAPSDAEDDESQDENGMDDDGSTSVENHHGYVCWATALGTLPLDGVTVLLEHDTGGMRFGRAGDNAECPFRYTFPSGATQFVAHLEVGQPVVSGTLLVTYVLELFAWWSARPDDPETLPAVELGPEEGLPQDALVRVTRALRFLDDAFGRQPERIPARARELLVRHVDDALHGKTDLLRLKLAFEVVGLLPAEVAGQLLARVLKLDNPWLNDVALRAARFVRALDPKAQKALRTWVNALPTDDFLARAPELARISQSGMLLAFLHDDVQARRAWEPRARLARWTFAVLVPWNIVLTAAHAAYARVRPDARRFEASTMPALALLVVTALFSSGDVVPWIQPVPGVAIQAMGLEDPVFVSTDRDDEQRRTTEAELTRLREARIASRGWTDYGDVLVAQWLEGLEGGKLKAVWAEEPSEATLRHWWSAHPERFEEPETWAYHVRAFRTVDEAQAVLDGERAAGRDPAGMLQASGVERRATEEVTDEDAASPSACASDPWDCADEAVARTLAVGERSAPYTVRLGSEPGAPTAAHVLVLTDHTPRGTATFDHWSVKPDWRAHQVSATARALLEAHAGPGTVVPLHYDLRDKVVLRYEFVEIPLDVDVYARAYALAWRDPAVVEAPKVQKALAEALEEERQTPIRILLRADAAKERRSARTVVGALVLIASLAVGVRALPYRAHRQLTDVWRPVRWVPVLVPVGFVVYTQPWWRTFTVWISTFWTGAASDNDPAEVVNRHLSDLSPHEERTGMVDRMLDGAAEPLLRDWTRTAEWLDAHLGLLPDGLASRLIVTSLPTSVAFAALWWFLVQYRDTVRTDIANTVASKQWGRTALLAGLTVVCGVLCLTLAIGGPLGVWRQSAEFDILGESARQPGADELDLPWLGVAGLAVLVIRLVLMPPKGHDHSEHPLRRMQERLGGAWQLAAWGASLLAGIVILVALWPIHLPLVMGLVLAGGGAIWAAMAAAAIAVLYALLGSAFEFLDRRYAAAHPSPAPTPDAVDLQLRSEMAHILTRHDVASPQRAALLDAIAAHHLAAGTVPTGEWPDGRVPYFYNDPVSSTRLAQLDEKWRGLDR